MIKVIFENHYGKDIELKEVETVKEADKVMSDFIEAHNFESPYCRVCGLEGKKGVLIDVGSYTEFFKFIGEGVYDYFCRERVKNTEYGSSESA